MALELSRFLEETNITEYMTQGKTAPTQKDHENGTVAKNYRPITCLPMM